jgi:DNA modification methylase
VLRKDGTLWLNLGDSYAGSGKGGQSEGKRSDNWQPVYANKGNIPFGLKPKDLCMIPARVALALQADGWWLRSDIIWAKPNPIPESVTDRPTRAHEYIFLLAKSRKYYYDQEAINENSITCDPRRLYALGQVDNRGNGHSRGRGKVRVPAGWDTEEGSHGTIHRKGREKSAKYVDNIFVKRNKRSVWTIPTQPFPEAHFATFPEEIPRICILAGCPIGGTVLDPFSGSGRTLIVAKRLRRKAIGIDLNPDYCQMPIDELAQEVLPFR